MRILLTGADGQLGRAIARQADGRGIVILPQTRRQLDITDHSRFDAAVGVLLPDMVINAAAYTSVDPAETHPDEAHAVNAAAPGYMAETCARHQIPMIHISTDFVFDGTLRRPYRENDPLRPLNVYGRTKAEGESAIRERLDSHLIVRTSWLYDARGANFVTTILNLAREREVLRVVADQQGSPTSATDLARALLGMARQVCSGKPAWGTYHFCNRGITTWHGFAETIIALARKSMALKVRQIDAIPTSEYPTPAERPGFSALDCTRIQTVFGILPPPWEESLKAVLEEFLPGNDSFQPLDESHGT